jgi:osmoprotectant transport system permease protein
MAEAAFYLAEIMMTVPSLALFGLLMVLLSRIGFSAIGFLPAVITLREVSFEVDRSENGTILIP